MLVSPDLKARYIAAALNAIEAELQDPDADREALAVLMSGVARVARELADGVSPPRPCCPPPVDRDNVIAFRRPRSNG